MTPSRPGTKPGSWAVFSVCTTVCTPLREDFPTVRHGTRARQGMWTARTKPCLRTNLAPERVAPQRIRPVSSVTNQRTIQLTRIVRLAQSVLCCPGDQVNRRKHAVHPVSIGHPNYPQWLHIV